MERYFIRIYHGTDAFENGLYDMAGEGFVLVSHSSSYLGRNVPLAIVAVFEIIPGIES